MAEQKENRCCEGKGTIYEGFKWGFGFFLAQTAGILIVSAVAAVIFYVTKLF